MGQLKFEKIIFIFTLRIYQATKVTKRCNLHFIKFYNDCTLKIIIPDCFIVHLSVGI